MFVYPCTFIIIAGRPFSFIRTNANQGEAVESTRDPMAGAQN